MTPPTASLDLRAVKQRQQQVQDDGDYAAVAAFVNPTAAVLYAAAGFSAGARVLDVACDSGTAALAATRREAAVVGINSPPPLHERARGRATAERLAIDFQ